MGKAGLTGIRAGEADAHQRAQERPPSTTMRVVGNPKPLTVATGAMMSTAVGWEMVFGAVMSNHKPGPKLLALLAADSRFHFIRRLNDPTALSCNLLLYLLGFISDYMYVTGRQVVSGRIQDP